MVVVISYNNESCYHLEYDESEKCFRINNIMLYIISYDLLKEENKFSVMAGMLRLDLKTNYRKLNLGEDLFTKFYCLLFSVLWRLYNKRFVPEKILYRVNSADDIEVEFTFKKKIFNLKTNNLFIEVKYWSELRKERAIYLALLNNKIKKKLPYLEEYQYVEILNNRLEQFKGDQSYPFVQAFDKICNEYVKEYTNCEEFIPRIRRYI